MNRPNKYKVTAAQCGGMVEVKAARYEKTTCTTPKYKILKTTSTQRVKPNNVVTRGAIKSIIYRQR